VWLRDLLNAFGRYADTCHQGGVSIRNALYRIGARSARLWRASEPLYKSSLL